MIELKNVTKKYDNQRAVDSLSLNIKEGEITVIIGPSGCGKTTTLRMINRLITPSSGTILVNGEDISTTNVEFLRRGIGYVIQNVGLFPHMTVAGNIAIVPRLLGWAKEERVKRVDELLELVGLKPDDYRGKYPGQLSGGEAQRIGVARALAANPPILLMDEPFGAVDPLNREVLQGEFLKIQKQLKKTVVFVTHDLDEAIRMADKILVMKDGKVIQFDSPDEILSNPADNFVRDFVGTNRALKRLSRFFIEDSYHSVNPVQEEILLNHQMIKNLYDLEFLWVVNSENILKGWVQSKGSEEGQKVGDIMTILPFDELGIHIDSSLKEALSKMLAQGVSTLPVIDSTGLLLGEISLEEIQSRSERG
ncbi:MAG: ABC transporter ATP-binding protein [Spirochaetaceae bacterium]|jgi:osmoprotectant transport system ATP-binding protein|nr:ABC transporter ATP-binding protein [Spirochaetaceae bacterium]